MTAGGNPSRARQRDRSPERTDEPATNRTNEGERCPECDGVLVVAADAAELVCDDCGLIADADRVDRGPEWRAFDGEQRERRSRVGAPATELMHDRGLSTNIDWRDRDAAGRSLSAERRAEMRRLRKWHERFRTRDAEDRNLKYALGEIDRMASGLGIPRSTRETASVIYRRALDEGLLPGRSIEGVAAATLYAATRLDGIARSIDEIATVGRVDALEIERTYRYVNRELELRVPPTDPNEYVGRFASALDCPDEMRRTARELVNSATEAGVHSGRHPVGIAAAALYAAATVEDVTVTQSDVADVADVSEVTIRNRYREVLEAHER